MIVRIGPSPVAGSIAAPTSKSFAQRAIAAALLAGGQSVLRAVEPSGDVSAALDAARALGTAVGAQGVASVGSSVGAAGAADVGGDTYNITGGLSPDAATVNIGESGLSARLFIPVAALCDREITVTGRGSVLSRPFGMVEAPLRSLGVEVRTSEGRLPVVLRGPLRGGEAAVDGSVSSQFITGLLTALPVASGDSVLRVSALNSRPYINMTLDVLSQFGISVEHNDFREFHIRGGQRYRPTDYRVEGDWSGASTLLVAGAVGGEICATNLNVASQQADAAILEALRLCGASVFLGSDSVRVVRNELRAFEFDATHCPDLFPALVALAASCTGVSVLRGASRLAHKESDRAAALAAEFGRMGIAIDLSQPDVMRVTGGLMHGAELDSHNDHRIAMAVAVAALNARGQTTIARAEAVEKSYPAFWNVLKNITI
ncbi:MAG: 3-phosphoshikimate 1-carboxyvinyltransferase [Rikenellaceae bacterium]|jgi:3-phosphoshikimate 1-carboxyvinyltransferase|nr:3-phosphoshikimate 1-carboxyvinyltransferase [Rikenellaceae bacterium]